MNPPTPKPESLNPDTRTGTSKRSGRRQKAAKSFPTAAGNGTSNRSDDAAIIGLSCRLPGADNASEFWKNLVGGIPSIQPVTASRWDSDLLRNSDGEPAGHQPDFWFGLLDQIDRFDHRFFQISPREARHMDPQQRLLMEETWRCIEDSGVALSLLQNKRTSVYVGMTDSEYHHGTALDAAQIDSYTATGNYPSVAANRLSYFLGLHGPSLAVDAACASSLASLQLARESLMTGGCDFAIAAAVSLGVSPWRYLSFSKSRMLSPDGKCKTFDAKADGFVAGEGLVVLLLRPLQEARAAGDHIYGVIRGLAVNHCGRSQSLTAPKVTAQMDVINLAFEQTNFKPSDVSYVEAHGTGTSLGDPIELEALAQIFQTHSDQRHFCQIGSAKTNIGHLQAAAGLAGVAKVLLMMQHREIPPHLNLSTPNPMIHFQDSPFEVAKERMPWKANGRGRPLRAGVSSFGFGGANTHCLLESCKSHPLWKHKSLANDQPQLFCLSARTDSDLARMISDWRDFTNGPAFSTTPIQDLCATLLTGRAALPFRFGGVITTQEDLKNLLNGPPNFHRAIHPQDWTLWLQPFSFPGWHSLKGLTHQNPIFAKHLERTLAEASQLGLVPDGGKPFYQETWNAPDIHLFSFISGYALLGSLMELGFRPSRVIFGPETRWLGLALSGAIRLRDGLVVTADPGQQNSIELNRPHISFFDNVNCRFVMPFCVRESYLKALVQDLFPSTEVLNRYQAQARKLLDNQYTFKKYLKEWQDLSQQYGIEPTRWLSDRSVSKNQAHTSLVLVTIIENCFRRLNKKWELSNQLLYPDSRFQELSDLLLDEALSKSELLTWLTVEASDLSALSEKVHSRHALLDLDKPYRHLKEHNQALVEVENPGEWLIRLSTAEYPPETADFGGPLRLVMGATSRGEKDTTVFSPSPSTAATYQQFLGQLWSNGAAIEWQLLHPPGSYQKVSLPTYPFAGDSFWIARQPVGQAGVSSNPSPGPQALYPGLAATSSPETVAAPDANVPIRDFFYLPRWEQEPLQAAPAPNWNRCQRIWVFYHLRGPDFRKAILDHHPDAKVTQIYLGQGDNHDGDAAWEIDVRDGSGFEKLVRRLGQVDAIYYLGGLFHSQEGPPDFDAIEDNQETALMGLFHLFKALQHQNILNSGTQSSPPLYMTVLTNQVFSVLPGERVLPSAGGLSGFMHTMVKEFPNLRMRCLDLDQGQRHREADHRALASGLAAVFMEDHQASGRDIAIRQNRRYRRIHVPWDLPPATGEGFRKEGSYLIIGGANGVGFEFAKYLSSAFHARLALVGRRRFNAVIADKISSIEALGGTAEYFQADIADESAITDALGTIQTQMGPLHGVIQSAVVFNETALKDMDEDQFRAVLTPKVQGSINLGRVLKNADLDFLMFFGSGQSYVANYGRAHYAAGCTFSDAFALSLTEELPFPVKIINWGYWQVGVMSGEAYRPQMDRLKRQGVQPIDSGLGSEAVRRFLNQQPAQALAVRAAPEVLALMGVALNRDEDSFATGKTGSVPGPEIPETGIEPLNFDGFVPASDHRHRKNLQTQTSHPIIPSGGASSPLKIARICETVAAGIASALEMEVRDLDWDAPLQEFGADSLASHQMVLNINAALNVEIQATDIFNYVTVRGLATHINEVFGPFQVDLPQTNVPEPKPWQDTKSFQGKNLSFQGGAFQTQGAGKMPPETGARDQDIAIIGVACRFPGADRLSEFWDLLAEGRCAVTEIPEDRWRWQDYYDPKPGTPNKCISKWGGFLSHIDRFDPLFFKISPKEAEVMDPQQRLFLMEAWKAFEDAGYADKSLAGKKCGVFVGCEDSDYLSMEQKVSENTLCGNSIAILAARISYFLNLKGPSVPIHTACSSALVAAHFACESLRNGTCDMALLGGVSLFPTPKLFLAMSQLGMLSPRGLCRTFDGQADGIVAGEGVGAVILKPLADAIKAGDQIYATIKGTSVNQDGKTNGITAPNGPSQTSLITGLYDAFQIAPETLGYVETHGTGTPLGDPIEVNALSAAFQNRSKDAPRCAIGSVKTNIGHALPASGMASLIKVILCLQKRKLVPSLHFETPNHQIDFANSPFYVNTTLADWENDGDHPRRAAISAFGISGTNAHLVVEEAPPQPVAPPAAASAYLLAFSARTPTALAQKLVDFEEWLASYRGPLIDLAFTLGHGRSHFEYRAAFVVRNEDELRQSLQAANARRAPENHITGEKGNHRWLEDIGSQILESLKAVPATDPELYQRLLAAANLYVQGMEIPWQNLPAMATGKRISLPNYPFADESYWLPRSHAGPDQASGLHPFLDQNQSTFNEHRFLKRFSSDDPLIQDHRVAGDWVFPATGIVEMARAAGQLMGDRTVTGLKNLVFFHAVRPLSGSGPFLVRLKPADIFAEFEVFSERDGEADLSHAQGKLRFAEDQAGKEPAPMDIASIQARCARQLSGPELYRTMAGYGLELGPSFQVIHQVLANEKEGFAKLVLPDHLRADAHRFVLHPALLDAAQQLSLMAGIMGPNDKLQVPFTISEMKIHGPLIEDAYAHVIAKPAPPGSGMHRCDIHVANLQGRVLVEIHGFLTRPFDAQQAPARQQTPSLVQLKPAWVSEQKTTLAQPPVRTLLVLGDTLNIAQTLGEHIGKETATPVRCISVQSGTTFTQLSHQNFTMDPGQPKHLEALFEALKTQQLWPTHIVHLGALALSQSQDDTLAKQLQSGLDSAYHLAHTLWPRMGKEPIRIVFAHTAAKDTPLPALGALGGFAKTLGLEHPKLACTSLFISQTETPRATDISRVLADELLSGSKGDAEIRYHHGHRQALRFQEISENAAGQTSASGITASFRRKGVYLITGGIGGIGMQLADLLAREYQARLAMIGRSPLSDEKEAKFEQWRQLGAEISYHRADLYEKDEVLRAISDIRTRYGTIHGVLHAAGITKDSNLGRKTYADLRAVLAPKVTGTIHLDEALAGEPLDFFVFFSSTTALLGYQGQSGYAFANRFLDYFAEQRERLRLGGKRSGRNLVINWPLWQESGMAVLPATQKRLESAYGMTPLSTPNGWLALQNGLASSEIQRIVIEGDRDKILATLVEPPASQTLVDRDNQPEVKVSKTEEGEILAAIRTQLTAKVSELLKVPVGRIRGGKNLSDYGFDSLSMTQFANQINGIYGLDVTPADFFEYPTLNQFTEYLLSDHREAVIRIHAKPSAQETAPVETEAKPAQTPPKIEPATIPQPTLSPTFETPTFNAQAVEKPVISSVDRRHEPIAIIGMSGRMPQSEDLRSFWKNLEAGKDLITEIPADRWDWQAYWGDPKTEPNKTKAKFAGFMKEVDKFDARFFEISRREADLMDPQQRIFLETVWEVFEDAGYRVSEFSGRSVGIYAGVSGSDYSELIRYSHAAIEAHTATGTLHCILPNRISYLLGFRGPSLAIDTACSSAMIAICQAVTALRQGECDLAVAGGINLLLCPDTFISFDKAGMLSPDGRCKTFDASANGYVRAEGVGALLLKPLHRAKADGDHIHAVIRGSAINHGGRVTTMTAPNPNAQSDLIVSAFEEGGIDPATVGYMEAHGTGTSLGDPIEVNGLKKAFQEMFDRRNQQPPAEAFCGIGSVKTNVGHLETSAAMSGIFKVILAMKHGKIPATIHFQKLNPYIQLKNSPFFIVDRNHTWPRMKGLSGEELPRRAGVSSFGFGGVNGHLVLEEYIKAPTSTGFESPQLMVLSAKTRERLQAQASQLASFLAENGPQQRQAPQSTQILQRDLQKICAEFLEVPTSELLVNDSLFELGFGRGHWARLSDHLAKTYAITMDDFSLSELDSLAEISSYLMQHHPGKFLDSPDPAPDGGSAPPTQEHPVRLQDLAYTLQTGRVAMASRLAVAVSDVDEFIGILKEFADPSANPTKVILGEVDLDDSDQDDLPALSPRQYQDLQQSGREGLSRLGRHWVEGMDLDWQCLYQNQKPSRIPLPTYPFAKERYWLPEIKAERPSSTIQHPLIDVHDVGLSLREGMVYRKTLHLNDPVVDQHRVNGQRVFPGVGHLLMVHGAAQELFHSAVLQLSEILWLRPVTLDETAIDLKLSLSENAEGRQFEIWSGDPDQKHLHSKGKLVAAASLGNSAPCPIADIQARCGKELEKAPLYQAIHRTGVELGPYFQTLQQVWIGDNEALAHLTLAANQSEADRYFVHPTMMDAALQIYGAMSAYQKHGSRLPFAAEKVSFYQPVGSEAWVHLQMLDDMHFNSAIYDANGRPCVVLDEVTLRESAPKAAPKEILFAPFWQRLPALNPIQEPHLKSGRDILVVTSEDDSGLVDALARSHQQDRVFCIRLDRNTQQTGDRLWQLDLDDPAGFGPVLGAIPHPQKLYFLGGLHAAGWDPTSEGALSTCLKSTAFALYRLIKALHGKGTNAQPLNLVMVSQDGYPVLPGDRISAYGGALPGMALSLAEEYTHWTISYVDVRAEDLDADDLARQVANTSSAIGDGVIAIRGNHRYQRRLLPLRHHFKPQLPFKKSGVYLILGGTGGLGLALARHLAKQAQAKLVLIGRQALTAQKAMAIQEIERLGGEVLYLRADAGDRRQMEEAILAAKARFRVIHGAFHSAMALCDRRLENMSEQDLALALTPKVQGGLSLVQALENEPLDFLVFFSSTQSFIGTEGQSNYAAACSFEDALALLLGQRTSFPVFTINWGFWGSVGAVATETYQKQLAARGFGSIEPEEGMDAISVALNQSLPQVVAVKADANQLQRMGVKPHRQRLLPDPTLSGEPIPIRETIQAQRTIPASAHGTLKQAYQGLAALEQFSKRLLLAFIREMGFFQSTQASHDKSSLKTALGLLPKFDRLLDALLDILGRGGDLRQTGQALQATPSLAGRLPSRVLDLEAEKDELASLFPDQAARLTLLWRCVNRYQAVLRGEESAAEVIFPDGKMSLVSEIYAQDGCSGFLNTQMAHCLQRYVAARLKRSDFVGKLRILEVGAGTGATSAAILEALAPLGEQIEYHYTDISLSFIHQGKRRFADRYPFVQFGLFHIEKDPVSQDIALGNFDVIIGTNVVHATADIRRTLQNLKSVLKPNGWLVLNEGTHRRDFATMIFGLLDGWWAFKDEDLRLAGSPLLSLTSWQDILLEEGFSQVEAIGSETFGESPLGQHVLFAESNGLVDQYLAAPVIADAMRPNHEKPSRAQTQKTKVTAASSLATPATPSDLGTWVNRQISEVVGQVLQEPDGFAEDQAFSSLGVDSILAVEIVNSLNRRLGIALRATELFNFSNIRKLQRHLLANYSDDLARTLQKAQVVDQPSTAIAEQVPAAGQAPISAHADEANAQTALQYVSDQLRSVLSDVLQAEAETLKETTPFSSFGVDSILAVEAIKKIGDTFAISLRNTDLFNFPNIRKLSQHIVDHYQVTPPAPSPKPPQPAPTITQLEKPDPTATAFRFEQNHAVPANAMAPKPQQVSGQFRKAPIAVIGMSGRFPGADNIEAFWQNLAAGECAIQPITRWPLASFFDPDPRKPHKSYGKWAGFLSEIDRFDPAFFNISPVEAEQMDPRQRLFLEETWKAIEDAGYSETALEGKKCAVFVGCGPGDYKLNHLPLPANAYTFSGSQNSILAARISYYLDLKGSSVAVDTACSSSLVALHLACESLRNGDCDMAIVGGTEILTTPEFFIQSSRANMLSPDGKCKAFDHAADGLVPGEAVGVVVLKRQDIAQRDGDQIHGLILGSGLNQDGSTNGITAPSAPSQTALVCDVYDRFGIDPENITYIEAHGTGTKLGDPIEIAALTDAFRKYTDRTQYCAVGSVKTNIGHTLTAAGVTGFIKVLLCLKHRQIVPSLNLNKENEFIDFRHSPFYVNTQHRAWAPPPGKPRMAAISSFGFSGTNAHVVVGEAPPVPQHVADVKDTLHLIPLSAKTEASLQQRIDDLADWLMNNGSAIQLGDVAFTLQTGRTHFKHRIAWLTGSVEELISQLQGQVTSNRFEAGPDLHESHPLSSEAEDKALVELGRLFVSGVADPDWSICHAGRSRRRISLPTYPFDRQRYWLNAASTKDAGSTIQRLHPMIDRNSSDLEGLQFESKWDGSEFFLADHRVSDRIVLPGVCYLEMARAAGALASGRAIGSLAKTTWLQPYTLSDPPCNVSLRLTPLEEGMAFRITSQNGAGERRDHAEGQLSFTTPTPSGDSAILDFNQIKSTCPHTMSGDQCYRDLAAAGFEYGPTYRVIQALHLGVHKALAILELPVERLEDFETFKLHPSLLDGALQSGLWLIPPEERNRSRIIPFSIGAVHLHAPLTPVCHALVTLASSSAQIKKLKIQLFDETGQLLLSVEDYTAKIHPRQPTSSSDSKQSTTEPDIQTFSSSDLALLALFQKVERGDLTLEEALKAYDTLNMSPSQ